MIKLVLTFLFFGLLAGQSATDQITVTLSGEGETEEKAKENATQKAIQQVYGVFFRSELQTSESEKNEGYHSESSEKRELVTFSKNVKIKELYSKPEGGLWVFKAEFTFDSPEKVKHHYTEQYLAYLNRAKEKERVGKPVEAVDNYYIAALWAQFLNQPVESETGKIHAPMNHLKDQIISLRENLNSKVTRYFLDYDKIVLQADVELYLNTSRVKKGRIIDETSKAIYSLKNFVVLIDSVKHFHDQKVLRFVFRQNHERKASRHADPEIVELNKFFNHKKFNFFDLRTDIHFKTDVYALKQEIDLNETEDATEADPNTEEMETEAVGHAQEFVPPKMVTDKLFDFETQMGKSFNEVDFMLKKLNRQGLVRIKTKAYTRFKTKRSYYCLAFDEKQNLAVLLKMNNEGFFDFKNHSKVEFDASKYSKSIFLECMQ